MFFFLHNLVMPVQLCVRRSCNHAARRLKLSFRPMFELLESRTVPSVVYNNAADFSATSNPNGVWSYGYLAPSASAETPDASTFTAFPAHYSATVLDVWGRSAASGAPVVDSNSTTSVANYQAAGSIITFQRRSAAVWAASVAAYNNQ
jgi:hypothetical protein